MRTFAPRETTALPAAFWWLFAGVSVMAAATFVFPFLALFLRSRGYSVTETGFLVALFGSGSIAAGPIAGWCADRAGRRPTLVAALAGASLLTATLPTFTSTWWTAAVTLALGMTVHAYWPAANAVIADVVPRERYADAYGLMYWARNAGIAFSFAVGGMLAARGFRLLFLVDAATTMLFAGVAWLKIPETRSLLRTDPQDGPRRGWGSVLADRHLRALLLLNVALLLSLFQFMVAVPVAMSRQGLTTTDFGLAMAVNGLLIVLLQPLSGRLTRHFDPAHVLALAALLVGAGYGSYAFCATARDFAVATAVWSLGEILTMPVVSSLVAEMSSPDLRGRYQGLLMLSFGVGLALAPALGGMALERLGPLPFWASAACLCLLVGVGHAAAGRARRQALDFEGE